MSIGKESLNRIGCALMIAIAALGLQSCNKDPSGATKAPIQKIKLQREWVANAEFAGDVWAQSLPAEGGPPIEVSEGSETMDPIKTVRSGTAQIGVASADRVLRENEGGADLVILAAATYKSPVVFLSHVQDKVKSPKDFRGKVIGIQTGTNTELVFKALLDAQGLSPSQMKVVESGWGTTNFESNAIAVLAAFDYDEPVQLALKSVKFGLLKPEEYGVQYVGTVYFAKRSTAEQYPEVLQSFMDRLVLGWKQAIAKPHDAIVKVGQSFSKMDVNKEEKSLVRGLPYFSGENGEILYASPERWTNMANSLQKLKVLKSFDFDKNVDYKFLENALHKSSPK